MVACMYLLNRFLLIGILPLLIMFFMPDSVKASHQTEVKFLIHDLSQLPPDILAAMKTGKEHPDILQRGLIVQSYLPLTSKNIIETFRLLKEANVPFGSKEQEQAFLVPGAAQEIRLMQMLLKKNGQLASQHVISFLGGEEISRTKLETPRPPSPEQEKNIIDVFARLIGETNHRVHKAHFEILARDRKGKPLLDENRLERSVEIDIFFHHLNSQITPFMIDGEIEFISDDPQRSLRQAKHFQQTKDMHPTYFSRDITAIERLKSRNLASARLPGFIAADMDSSLTINQYYFSKFISEFKQWIPADAFKEATTSDRQNNFLPNTRVLLNAEPFGFGPTSLIGEIFPYLRNSIQRLSYIGTGHTLDIQRHLPYDNIYEYADKGISSYNDLADSYDVFITACDFQAAQWAKSLGLKVIIYDPLTWYWKEVPEIISQSDLYLSQNFFGVRQRLEKESEKFPEYRIVPPVVSKLYNSVADEEERILLVNFGGLANPYMTASVLKQYISTIILVIDRELRPSFDKIYYLGSRKLAADVGTLCKGCAIQTLLPQQVQQLLARSSLAFMTSGLGNIYEAATAGKKVVWLPPANDSQGQQVKALIRHHMIDFAIDWHDILPDSTPVNYYADQPEVLSTISDRMALLTDNRQAEKTLAALFQSISQQAADSDRTNIEALSKMFSFGGAKIISDSILQWLKEASPATPLNLLHSLQRQDHNHDSINCCYSAPDNFAM